MRTRFVGSRITALVVLSLLGVLMALGPPGTSRAGACSIYGPSMAFVGLVEDRSDGIVTYRVETEETDGPFHPPVGSVVQVRYQPKEARRLEVGERYKVLAFDYGDGLESQLAYEFKGDCGSGMGTSRPDGSFISADDGVSWVWWAGGFIVVGAAVSRLLVRRDARRRTDPGPEV